MGLGSVLVFPEIFAADMTPDNHLLTVSQAAIILGVSEGSLYNMVSSGLVPYVKIGRRVRFVKQDLWRWIYQQRVA